jgi:hypothetical protein
MASVRERIEGQRAYLVELFAHAAGRLDAELSEITQDAERLTGA